MSKEVENLKTALELAKSKLQVAEKALNDIVRWDNDLKDEWGDPGKSCIFRFRNNDDSGRFLA